MACTQGQRYHTFSAEVDNGISSRVCVGTILSPSFTTASGVRQGCVLAPMLPNATIDFVVEHVSRQVGISLGSRMQKDH